LSTLQKHLTGVVEPVVFRNVFFDFLAFAQRSLTDPRAMEMEQKLFAVINKRLTTISILTDPWDLLIGQLSVLDGFSTARDLILEFMTFIGNFAEKEIPLSLWVALEKAFARLTSHNKSEFLALLRLLQGEDRPLTQGPVNAAHPFALKLLFQVFVSDPEIDVLDLLSKALSISRNCCLLAHEYGFDLCLLDHLFARRETAYPQTSKILDLFRSIAVYISSPIIVQRYLLLFHPIDSRYLSPTHPPLLKPLEKLFDSARLRPSISLPLEHVCSSNLTLPPDGVTITCWFCTEILRQTPIFTLTGEGQRSVLVLSLTNDGHLQVNQTPAEVSITLGRWHFIAVTVMPDTYQLFLDGEQTSTVFTRLAPSSSILTFTMGSAQATLDLNYGPFAFTKALSINDIRDAFTRGPRTMMVFSNSIFPFSETSPGIVGQ
jgi:hypothetical protein